MWGGRYRILRLPFLALFLSPINSFPNSICVRRHSFNREVVRFVVMKRGVKKTEGTKEDLELNDIAEDSEAKPKRTRVERPLFERDNLSSKPVEGRKLVKVVSWNVAGLRSLIKNHGGKSLIQRQQFRNIISASEALDSFLSSQSPDFLCLQVRVNVSRSFDPNYCS